MSRSSLREKVYETLDGERAYQDGRSQAENHNRSLGDLILLQDVYVAKAKAEFAKRGGKIAALDAVRKVTALGVLIAELHGLAYRG